MIIMVEVYKQYCLMKNHIIIYLIVTLKGDKKNKRVWKMVKTNAQIRTQIKDWVNTRSFYTRLGYCIDFIDKQKIL